MKRQQAQRHPSTTPFGRELRAERLGAGRRKVLSVDGTRVTSDESRATD